MPYEDTRTNRCQRQVKGGNGKGEWIQENCTKVLHSNHRGDLRLGDNRPRDSDMTPGVLTELKAVPAMSRENAPMEGGELIRMEG